MDFVEEARFAKDDFGAWRVSYNYDTRPTMANRPQYFANEQ